MTTLTKSRFLSGLQCYKKLWLEVHEPEKIPRPSPADQFIMDQGTRIGRIAAQRYSDGLLLPQNYMQIKENVAQTHEELKNPRPLFEAGFQHERCYARVDIFNPIEGGWELIEVKSSTKPKDEYYYDLAFQKYIIDQLEIPIKGCYLLLVNPDYVKQGDIDPNKFMVMHNMDVEVNSITREILQLTKEMRLVIDSSDCPDTSIGYHCATPRACPFEQECWGFVPQRSVFDLERDTRMAKAKDLMDQGILELENIPDGYDLKPKQEIQVRAAKTGKPVIDKKKISDFLKKLDYSLHCLDFETAAPAVPVFDGTRPYEPIVTQFSVHTIQKNGKITHKEFIVDTINKRGRIVDALIDAIPDDGTVLGWTGYEKQRLEDMARGHPEQAERIRTIIARLVDLSIPFKNFWYYHPDQGGKYSIKYVLPAMTNISYDHLTIKDGAHAAMEFINTLWTDKPEKEKKKVRDDLLRYCALDTEGMVEIIKELYDVVK